MEWYISLSFACIWAHIFSICDVDSLPYPKSEAPWTCLILVYPELFTDKKSYPVHPSVIMKFPLATYLVIKTLSVSVSLFKTGSILKSFDSVSMILSNHNWIPLIVMILHLSTAKYLYSSSSPNKLEVIQF